MEKHLNVVDFTRFRITFDGDETEFHTFRDLPCSRPDVLKINVNAAVTIDQLRESIDKTLERSSWPEVYPSLSSLSPHGPPDDITNSSSECRYK